MQAYGESRGRLENLVSRLELKERVNFVGKISDEKLLECYNNCSLFVLPNRLMGNEREVEGFGIVLLEAMACARPVIGGNCGRVSSAIKEDWGLLFEPNNH